MQALGITYVDKELGGNPRTARVKQWWFEDANEVKEAVNNHKDLLNQFTFRDPLNNSIANLGKSTDETSSYLGLDCGISITSGVGNTLNGYNAGKAMDIASGNTVSGSKALESLVFGSNNSIHGREALRDTEGSSSSIVGAFAFRSVPSVSSTVSLGIQNGVNYGQSGTNPVTNVNQGVFIGSYIRPLLANSVNEVIIGDSAFGKGSNTVTLGNDSIVETHLKGATKVKATVPGQKLLELKTFGGDTTLQADDNGSVWNSGVSGVNTNTHFGFEAGLNNTDKVNQTFVGYLSGKSNTGILSIGVGSNSLQNNTGDECTGIGIGSLDNNIANRCSSFGYLSLNSNEGGDSCAFGYLSGQNNKGASASAFGFGSLLENEGDNCSGFGRSSLQNNTGNNCSAFGFASLLNNNGFNNTSIGYDSASETSFLLGSNNTFLGTNATYGTNVNISNSTAVGANITLEQSNSVILGNNADVGIGTTAPTAKLTVENTVPGQNLLELKTFAGQDNFIVEEEKTIIQGSLNGGGNAPLIVNQLTPFGAPFDQNIQEWLNAGSVVARMRADGNFSILNNQAVLETGYFRARTGGSPDLVTFGSNTGGIKTGLWFPSNSIQAFVSNGKETKRIDEVGRIGVGTSTTLISGTVTSNIEPTALFHVDSNNGRDVGGELKGSIPFPRMTQAERTAITSPAIGLHVYQTDGTEGVYVNKSTGWVFAY